MPLASQARRAPSDLQPLARKPLREEIYRVLRRTIVQGRLEPGAKIVEGRLAAALGVSRTPVREALHRLEYDGLVINRPGYSTRVTALTVTDVEEIYPIITVLEGLAGRLATPRLSPADLSYMDELTHALAHHARRGEIEKLMAADTRFHAVLHERSQNRRLQRIIAELRGQMERFEYVFFSSPAHVRASLARHKKLVRVLRRGDPAAAEQTLIRQWELGRHALLEMVRENKMAAEEPAGLAALRVDTILATKNGR